MKSGFLLFLALTLIFVCGISFAADEFTVAQHTFEVPNGYSLNQSDDNISTLVRDNNTNYTIFVTAGEIPDDDTAKSSREVVGFKFIGENSYTTDNDIVVNQQNYIKNESFFLFYKFDINGTDYLIGYMMPVHDEMESGDDNPANAIIESLKN